MYEPEPLTHKDTDDLGNYIYRELQRISDSFLLGQIDTLEFKVFYELPPRPVEGVMAYIDESADASIINTGLYQYKDDEWQLIAADESWTEVVTFNTNWTNYGVSNIYNTAAYCKVGNVVHLKGLVTHISTGVGTFVFNLPEGYRPVKNNIFTAFGTGGVQRIDITSGGNVVLTSGDASSYLSLDGITFRAI